MVQILLAEVSADLKVAHILLTERAATIRLSPFHRRLQPPDDRVVRWDKALENASLVSIPNSRRSPAKFPNDQWLPWSGHSSHTPSPYPGLLAMGAETDALHEVQPW